MKPGLHSEGQRAKRTSLSRSALGNHARVFISALLFSSGLIASAAEILPLEFRQTTTTFNFQSQRGVPISSVSNSPAGSNGQQPPGSANQSGSNLPATTNQFRGFASFGALAGPTNVVALSNSVILRNGTTAFSPTVALQMQLPVGRSNGVVSIVMRRAQVGAPYLNRQISFLFGSVVSVPATDETGTPLTNIVKETYWLPEPYTINNHSNAPYYWSPHSGQVYAIQPGPITIRWVKSSPTNGVPFDYSTNSASYYTNGGNYFRIFNVNYIVSGSAVKPPKKMYWTEKTFQNIGKLITVPTTRVGAVNIVYNNNFPRTVTAEYSAPGQSNPTDGTTNAVLPELRTLWYDSVQGNIHAYNQEGRVFVELLGDARPDGESRVPLGFEIVDVFKQVTPQDVTVELGERILPPPPATVDALFPEPLVQSSGLTFAFSHNIAGSQSLELFATRETQNQNDYMVYWMETGVVGLRWPSLFARYQMVWPSDVSKYSHYIRPLVATENEAKQTAVPLSTDNVPTIDYQDPLDRPRAKLTEEFKFYTFLEPAYPAHRALLRFTSGEEVAFERVFSWLDASLKTTNFANSVAVNLDSWNTNDNSFNFQNDLAAPRVVNASAEVGLRIEPPFGEMGSIPGQSYLAGYIRQAAGTLFNPGAYIDPFVSGFGAANGGAIIPVNAIPGTNILEVWWFRTNVANAAKGFKTIYWPSVIGHYTNQWPANPNEIVLASKKGSAGSGVVDPLVALGTIYYQNNPALPGYNPNEEHAIMSGGTSYALRDDLNITNGPDFSSLPFVLVDYKAADNRPSMAVYKVLREKLSADWLFDYIVKAGSLLEPPMPLPLLAPPTEGSGDNTINYTTESSQLGGDLPGAWNEARDAGGVFGHYKRFTYRDRKQGFWVYRGLHSGLPTLQSGTYNPTNKTFGSLPTATAITGQFFSYFLHVSRQDQYLTMAVAPGSTLPAWLNIAGLSIQGTPATNNVGTNTLQLIVADLYDGTQVTNTLTVRVQNSGVTVAQGPLQILSTNSYTGVIVNFSNRPPFLAHSPVSSNSFTMRFYYKTEPSFAWPGFATPPAAGSIVPYLRPLTPGTNTYVGDPTLKTTPALDIVYRPVWPVKDPADEAKPVPTLPYGQTLTAPVAGLPGVRDFKTAVILYQQSIGANITNAAVSAVLHDATRAKFSRLGSAGLSVLPGGVAVDLFQGKYFFPNLPPHLSSRMYFDPNIGTNGSIVFKGEFKDEITGEKYVLLNVLRGSDLAAVKALCPSGDPDYSKWTALIDNLATSVETFHENPSIPGTYIPDPPQTVSVGVGELAVVQNENTAVDSYALSGTGPGAGYITIVEGGGAAFTKPSDPVALHILKVGGSLYSGELKGLAAPNPLSEQVTMQHTADLAGRYDEYQYEWKIGAPVDGLPPVADATMSQYVALTSGSGISRYTLGGAGIRALSDNYVVMRYRPLNPSHPFYKAVPTDADWSAWTSPKLAEGWIKRVLAGINPFNQRTTDLFNNQANTVASIISQAGHRWEGDIALNADTLNSHGLIEIYETILRRGRLLSIESGYNYGPANDALLLAAGYLNDLYMMLGSEAWADASNPTIGIGTKDHTYGDIATALFAFKGQVPSLLEEELALLRGRDDFLLPGVQTTPFYNRLVWNYTRGIDAGEVIYALNYNILDQDHNGSVDAADAAALFPQAHGDAYGHYLTALMGYYSLLMNANFDWVPRIEAVNVLGQAVSVDYQDERKFAAAASALGRSGRQIFDLTWLKDYQPGHANGWNHLGTNRINLARKFTAAPGVTNFSTRYWGADHWAARTSQGTYLNWVVGNAILPATDPNPLHEGIQKIDRTTVPELTELPAIGEGLQTAMDQAEGGLTPLGLPDGAVAFDINPNAVVGTDSGTHFEQIYSRAKVALNNAVAAFDDAKDVTRLMRSEQDSLADFQAGVDKQELAFNNSLIELYGSAYPDDVGPGKTYRQGFTGPDLLHYAYVDSPQITFPGLVAPNQSREFRVDIQNYTDAYNQGNKSRFDFVVRALNNNAQYLQGTNYISFTLDSYGQFTKPANWTGKRPSPGKIQEAISRILLARNAALETLANNEGQKRQLDRTIEYFNAKVALDAQFHQYDTEKAATETAIEGAIFAAKMVKLGLDTFSDTLDKAAQSALEAIPKSMIVGTAVGGDTFSAARSAILAGFGVSKAANDFGNFAKEFVVGALQVSKNGFLRQRDADVIGPLTRELEDEREVLALDAALNDLQSTLFTINQRLQEMDSALRNYQSLLAQGDRIQEERQVFRQRAAAVIQGFRTRDAAFRLFRNEKLERYKTLFDLSSRYAFLAANAYDYETGLLNTERGRGFLNRIVSSRALGVIRNGEPQFAGSNTGDPGLSSALAEMKADWDVLRGRLGFNNPDAYGTTASLRTENYRILPGTNGLQNWQNLLQQSRKANILDDADVRRYCMQIDPGNGTAVPGIVLEFSTTIANGFNLFGQQLAAGDHAYSPSSFATKIFAVGASLEGYRGMDAPAANAGAGGTSPSDPNVSYLDPLALSATPYVYLIPVGLDAMRSPPLGDASEIRTWSVNDIAIPLPFNIGDSDLSTLGLYQSSDSLSEPLFAIRKHQAFRPVPSASYFSTSLYGTGGTLLRSQYTNNRLVARSVWNTRWKLVIPGNTLLNDPKEGLDRFNQTVTDIKLHFVTYSYSGN